MVGARINILFWYPHETPQEKHGITGPCYSTVVLSGIERSIYYGENVLGRYTERGLGGS